MALFVLPGKENKLKCCKWIMEDVNTEQTNEENTNYVLETKHFVSD